MLFSSILTDFVTSHKIAFYSKLFDIDFLENCTHDRTYITLYVHEFLLRLHQHCFLDKKAPRTTYKYCKLILCYICCIHCINYRFVSITLSFYVMYVSHLIYRYVIFVTLCHMSQVYLIFQCCNMCNTMPSSYHDILII